ncbi:MAG: hypothetical protein WBQ23_07875 [Bacteroidota bacterium]
MKRALIFGIILLFISSCSGTGQESTDIYGHVQRDSTRNTWHASLTGSDAGLWFCSWSERTRSGAAVRGAFLERGQRQDFRFLDVSGPVEGVEDERPSAAFLTDSTLLVVWQRRSGTSNTILARVLSINGSMREVFEVSNESAPAMMPSAGCNTVGEVLVTWQDYRNGDVDIYAQKFDASARRIGTNVKINDDNSHALQGQPRAAADNASTFLLLWPDNRDDGAWKFYYQRFGSANARNVLIDSAQRKAMTTLISGTSLGNDSAVFAWKDYREGHSNIYLRRADLNKGTFTSAERINDDTGERWQRLAAIDGNGQGNIVLCWEDYRNTEINQRGDIYMQAFARDGLRIGANMKVNDRDDRIARKMPSIVMESDGLYLVIWHQGEEGAFHLAGQWLRYPSERVGANFCLTCGKE